MRTESIEINEVLDIATCKSLNSLKLELIVISNKNLNSSLVKNCQFKNVVFSECNFYACDFRGLDLSHCIFENCTFEFSHFRNSLIDNCNFENCKWNCSSILDCLIQDSIAPKNFFDLAESGKSTIQIKPRESSNLFSFFQLAKAS